VVAEDLLEFHAGFGLGLAAAASDDTFAARTADKIAAQPTLMARATKNGRRCSGALHGHILDVSMTAAIFVPSATAPPAAPSTRPSHQGITTVSYRSCVEHAMGSRNGRYHTRTHGRHAGPNGSFCGGGISRGRFGLLGRQAARRQEARYTTEVQQPEAPLSTANYLDVPPDLATNRQPPCRA